MNVVHFIIGVRQNGSYQLVKNISQMQLLQRRGNCASVILLLLPLITSITTHKIQFPFSVYKMTAICQENMALDNVY
jgi:hypothetical protein